MSGRVVVRKFKLPTSCLYFVGSSSILPSMEVSFKFFSIGVATGLQPYIPNLSNIYPIDIFQEIKIYLGF